MKWRFAFTLAFVITVLAAVCVYFPHQKWLAVTILLPVCGGIYYDRREQSLEAKAAAADERRNDLAGVALFFLLLVLAFVIGVGCSLLYALGLWSLGVGVLSLVIFMVTTAIYNRTDEEAKLASTPPLNTPAL